MKAGYIFHKIWRRWHHQWCSILVLYISYFYFGVAIDCGGNQVANTIIVDQQGKGAFQTIQAAIDSIKSQNNQWIMININPGIYK